MLSVCSTVHVFLLLFQGKSLTDFVTFSALLEVCSIKVRKKYLDKLTSLCESLGHLGTGVL